MQSSPTTPAHSRGPSNIDISIASPTPSPSLRRYSKSSAHSPSASRHSLARSDSIGLDVHHNNEISAGNGLGSLADELADADSWDEDDEDGEEPDLNFHELEEDRGQDGNVRDSGVDVTDSPSQPAPKSHLDRLVAPTSAGRGHRRKGSEYDGSDYGDESDLETHGLPRGLVVQMDMVESLARRGTESNGTESDGVVHRVVDELRDLGSQSGVEGNCSRLITAHSALSSHLLHQTRLLSSLTYPLFSPLTLPPSPEAIDEILPLLLDLTTTAPKPTPHALHSLQGLHGLSNDLIQSLAYLSDTLHMSRQTTLAATRQLRNAREYVGVIRQEEVEREASERWLRRGNWDKKLERREGAKVCGEVVEGFERVCEGWRRRLLEQEQGECVDAVGA